MNTTLNLHPADIAENLSTLSRQERNLAFLKLTGEQKGIVFPFLSIDIQKEIIKGLAKKDYAEMLNNLEPDDRTGLFDNFPDELIKYSINLLNDVEKQIALDLIGYDKNFRSYTSMNTFFL